MVLPAELSRRLGLQRGDELVVVGERPGAMLLATPEVAAAGLVGLAVRVSLDEIRSRRDDVLAVARRHGVQSLHVVVREPGVRLPRGFQAYFEAAFEPEVRVRRTTLGHFGVLERLQEDLTALLGRRVCVGDREGYSLLGAQAAQLRDRAVPV